MVQARSDDETTLGEGYGYIWQKINIPNGDIINATFSLDYEADEDSSTKEYVWVAVKDGYNVSNEGWESQLGMAYEKIYTANLTDIVKQYAGKSLYVLAGLHIVSGSKLKYVETTLYNVSLTITYKVSSSGSGGWWGNGGSWSGGGSGGWWGSGSGWSGGGGFWHGSGGVWFAGNTSGNATYVEYVVGNIQRALAIVGGAVISVLWVKEALDFFSDDPDRKSRAKENALKALLATLIIAMAVLGTIWLLAGWAVGAFDIVGVIL
ncbi:hypothetical protein ABOONEI_943 [Aciduliprofundum boonei T469]|nr:hypothetical protein ABOONEI_943 [Aciduliprofundum boonei T469]